MENLSNSLIYTSWDASLNKYCYSILCYKGQKKNMKSLQAYHTTVGLSRVQTIIFHEDYLLCTFESYEENDGSLFFHDNRWTKESMRTHRNECTCTLLRSEYLLSFGCFLRAAVNIKPSSVMNTWQQIHLVLLWSRCNCTLHFIFSSLFSNKLFQNIVPVRMYFLRDEQNKYISLPSCEKSNLAINFTRRFYK